MYGSLLWEQQVITCTAATGYEFSCVPGGGEELLTLTRQNNFAKVDF